MTRLDHPLHNIWSKTSGRRCERWDDFLAFVDDMERMPKPSPKHWFGRIDLQRPFAPDNVQWMTRAEVMHRMRRNVLNWDLVHAIRERRARGESSRSIALALGLNRNTVDAVATGRAWREELPKQAPAHAPADLLGSDSR